MQTASNFFPRKSELTKKMMYGACSQQRILKKANLASELIFLAYLFLLSGAITLISLADNAVMNQYVFFCSRSAHLGKTKASHQPKLVLY